ncbi:MAG: hypothetical protein EOO88_63420, partial [Pedobacter sp.]
MNQVKQPADIRGTIRTMRILVAAMLAGVITLTAVMVVVHLVQEEQQLPLADLANELLIGVAVFAVIALLVS